MSDRWLQDPDKPIQHYLTAYHEPSNLWTTLCRLHIPSTEDDIVTAGPEQGCRACLSRLRDEHITRNGIDAARAALAAARAPKGLKP